MENNPSNNTCAAETLGDQQTAYFPTKIAELTKRIIGGQTVAQFAHKSGISKSWISKAANGKLPGVPTRRILTRLWENSEDPTIQLSELLRAAGWDSKEPNVTCITPKSIVSTYIAGNTLNPLYVFMKTVKLDESVAFTLRYEHHKFSVDVNDGEKRYVCYPALCYGLYDTMNAVIAETILNMLEKDGEARDDHAITYVLTDEEDAAKYFKKLSDSFAEPFYVLLTSDYVTANNYYLPGI